jgi:small multidrug resistance pump
MALAYGALLSAIILGVFGQLMLKSGVMRTPGFIALLLDPFTIVGLMAYGVAAVCYIMALKRIPITIAYPSVAISYVVVSVTAHFVWHEPLGWPQLAGIALIGGGLVMLHVSA